MAEPRAPLPIDMPTLVGIAIVGYALDNQLHEALGHGGACLLVGGVARALSTVHFECGEVAGARAAVVAAAGTLVNLAAGLIALALLRSLRSAAVSLRLLLWLSAAVNLFGGGGYLMVPTPVGFGDWYEIVKGNRFEIPARIGLALLGAAISFWALAVIVRELEQFLGRDRAEREQRAWRLTLVPYFSGGILACVAGALNPVGWQLVLISAAASTLGGTAFLAWLAALVKEPKDLATEAAPPLARSPAWIAAGAITAAAFLWLGRGIQFRG